MPPWEVIVITAAAMFGAAVISGMMLILFQVNARLQRENDSLRRELREARAQLAAPRPPIPRRTGW